MHMTTCERAHSISVYSGLLHVNHEYYTQNWEPVVSVMWLLYESHNKLLTDLSLYIAAYSISMNVSMQLVLVETPVQCF